MTKGTHRVNGHTPLTKGRSQRQRITQQLPEEHLEPWKNIKTPEMLQPGQRRNRGRRGDVVAIAEEQRIRERTEKALVRL